MKITAVPTYKCDKCGVSIKSHNLPANWVGVAIMDDSRKQTEELHLCRICFKDLKKAKDGVREEES